MADQTLAEKAKKGAQAVEKAKETPYQMIERFFRANEPQIARSLRSNIKPATVLQLALNSIRLTPGLIECMGTPDGRLSLMAGCLASAQLGLDFGPLGLVYLVPFKKKAVFIIGYKGLVQLMYRSERIVSVEAHPVFDGDEFDYQLGDEGFIRHRPGPNSDEEDPAKLIYAYSVIKVTGGGKLIDVMSRAAIDKIRKRSRAGSDGPWVTDYIPMACKTVLKRGAKYAPLSVEAQAAVGGDESVHTQLAPDVLAATPDVAETVDLGDITEAEVVAEHDVEAEIASAKREQTEEIVARAQEQSAQKSKAASKAEPEPEIAPDDAPEIDF